MNNKYIYLAVIAAVVAIGGVSLYSYGSAIYKAKQAIDTTVSVVQSIESVEDHAKKFESFADSTNDFLWGSKND